MIVGPDLVLRKDICDEILAMAIRMSKILSHIVPNTMSKITPDIMSALISNIRTYSMSGILPNNMSDNNFNMIVGPVLSITTWLMMC